MQRIEIDQDFDLPVQRVYAFLAEHENLGPLFGAQVTRVRDGVDARNGAGSVRRLKVGPLPAFEETVTEAVPYERIEYRITSASLLKNHRGVMELSPNGSGSHLHYVIEFDTVVPLLDRVLAPQLERTVRAGLRTVDAKA